MGLNNLFTRLFLIGGAFQLSLFGFLPYGFKFIGDSILFGLILVAYLKGFLKKLPNKFSNVTYIISVTFIIYYFMLGLYSIFEWGEVKSTIIWSRRWLIFSLYLLITSTNFKNLLNKKIILRYMIFGTLVSILSIILERDFGINLSGTTTSYEAQGGLLIVKTFTPGNFLIMVFTLYITVKFLYSFNLRYFIFASFFNSLFFYTINFRSWWLVFFASIFLSLIVIFWIKFNKEKIKVKKIIILHLIAFSIILILIALGNTIVLQASSNPRFEWITSAFNDFKNADGNMGTRFDKDTSRIISIWESNINQFKLLGVGFVAEGSLGHAFLGFTSETNDSGWVEVLLTGGIVGSALFLLVWILNLSRIYKIIKSAPTNESIVLFAIWFTSLPLMISSNPFLWDFGFIPIIWLYLFSLSEEVRKDGTHG
ncbi:hypothetical protein [Bacillus sp. FJAT-27245]|uniref:hypothetical protein n=1 Tax=Bacillus sp. FJAT-27245 TaxID=1684144 RepID=UPI0006A7CD09|nr:hypothetical protein [Bacillus sp. FJAT-27245]